MNSNSLPKGENVFLLEKKRDVELPKQLMEIDEKLRDRRATVLKPDSKIDNLKGGPRLITLMDIPFVVWGLIQEHCNMEQKCGILNVCLASPTLDHLIKNNSVRNTLRITGEKVFHVLLENSYLDKNDVTNCLNSDSTDLKWFAGTNWVYSEEWHKFEREEFRSAANITDFAKIASQSKQKWQLFAFKNFRFDSHMCNTREEYEVFWKAALIFIKRFGNVLLDVTLVDQFIGDGVKKIISKDLLQRLPRIKVFYYFDNRKDVVKSGFDFHSRSDLGDSHMLRFCHIADLSSTLLEEIGPLYERWCLTAKHLAQISLEQRNICRNVKCLRIDAGQHEFIDADLSNFVNVVTLILCGNSESMFSVLKKIPNVKTVRFSVGFRQKPLLPPQSYRLPRVTKLILHNIISGYIPLQMDAIAQWLPSLVQLTINAPGHNKTDFSARLLKELTEDGDFQQQNKIIDFCRVFAECRSIRDSNIWQHMQNLSRIIVETVAKYHKDENGRRTYSNEIVRTEIFRRP